MGELFAGVSGFGMGFEQAGFEVAWQVEIDRDAGSVLERHYPNVTRYGDVATVDPAELAPVDVVIFGSPCQDFSVAGKRAGLSGERSGLFGEAIRIIAELRPDWIVFENVPGLLSSHNGDDFHAVMDAFESLRYIGDCDILDSRYFGVPQRRRRVFVVCESVESFQRKRTESSSLTLAQCLIEISHAVLIVQSRASATTPTSSVSESRLSVDGLMRRMRLFGLPSENDFYATWLERWDAKSQRSASEPDTSISARGDGSGLMTRPVTPSASLFAELTASGTSSLNTEPSWKSILDGLCDAANQCITSTGSRTTTDSTIYSCAQALLSIGSLICRSSASCPSYWSAESSALTALEGFTSYARSAGNSLFTDLEWVQPWRDFVGQADDLRLAFERARAERAGQVLFESPSGNGHPAARGEAREGIAGDVEDGAGVVGFSESGPGWWRDGIGTIRAEGENRPSRPSSVVGEPIAYQCHGNNVGAIGTLRQGNGGLTGGVPFVLPPVAAFGGNRTSGPIDVATACNAHGGPHGRLDFESETFVVGALPSGGTPLGHGTAGVNNQAVNAGHVIPVAFHLTQDPINGAESPALGAGNAHGCSTVAVAVFDEAQITHPENRASVVPGAPSPTLNQNGQISIIEAPVAVAQNQRGELVESSYAHQFAAAGGGKPGEGYVAVREGMAVRRLTPRECERLMGWEDDHTRYRADGSEIPDGPRYRLIGNGVVAPVAAWIAKRLRAVMEGS